MLVGRVGSPRRVWLGVLWGAALLSAMLIGSLAPHLTQSTELVRLRNSLLYEVIPADSSWAPAEMPASYHADRDPPNDEFRAVVVESGLAVPGDDWETALRIGRHLLRRVTSSSSAGPIMRDLSQTYRHIVEQGEGYCGDFSDVFTGLATSAGIFARAWAFSFDGFGGHGHIFNEIWDGQAGKWRMIDVFNNQYAVDSNGEPMSALALRESLLRGEATRWRPILASARAGFPVAGKADEYYRRGVAEWYLWWGNDVFEYSDNVLVRQAGSIARSLEQMAAIAVGVHPNIRVLETRDNLEQRRALYRLKILFELALILLPILFLLMLLSGWKLWVGRRRTNRMRRMTGDA